MIKGRNAALLASLLLAGCGGSGNLSGDYAQRYQIEYDATQNLTIVQGAFSRNGTNVQLLSPATILAGQTALTFNPSNMSSYPYSTNVSGRTNPVLVFTDFDGNRYENTVAVTNVPSIGFPEGFTGFSRTGTSTLTWAGTPVSTGETVILTAYGAAGVVREYNASVFGATSLQVNGGEIFGIGATRVKLSRLTTPALAQTSPAGGSLRVSYSTGLRTITTF